MYQEKQPDYVKLPPISQIIRTERMTQTCNGGNTLLQVKQEINSNGHINNENLTRVSQLNLYSYFLIFHINFDECHVFVVD